MRDPIDEYYDEDLDTEPRRGLGAVGSLALIGALALIAAPAIKSISRKWRLQHPAALREPAIDDSLKETFPASDPPAQRYFDIPENRR